MKKQTGLLLSILCCVCASALAADITIQDGQGKLTLTIDTSKGAVIRRLVVNGRNVLAGEGVYTGFSLGRGTFFTSSDGGKIRVRKFKDRVMLEGIVYGNDALRVRETWEFVTTASSVRWKIRRAYDKAVLIDADAFPAWHFAAMDTWKGGILDNGGVVWCKYLQHPDDTYGVHTGGVTFWNPASGDGLRVVAQTGGQVAETFSHGDHDAFTVRHTLSDVELRQRYHLSRYVGGRKDVFAPFAVAGGEVSVEYTLSYVDYGSVYSRGHLPGVNANAVRELLNTTARYGVVDNGIVGGNGWLTNWKCLHEPFFSQIALAVDDSNYTRNLSASLDRERDLAMQSDGRVLSRWHDVTGDEIPGTYDTATGYYETVWGYTIDSQTGYVINTSEAFDLNGRRDWLQAHKASCERALNWMIARDSDHNGIYEMKNNGIADGKSSDWLDIVWASYENAFVNAQLYRALVLWSDCERVLGDGDGAHYYDSIAVSLKAAFNRPVALGGFWSEQAGQYVYWRDRDGSIHGDNMVTPVNFAVIAFGLCDDRRRARIILDAIERRMNEEKLFHWPLCFDSFKKDEVSEGNWPFPKYENGDIFPTWGYLGVEAYLGYRPAIAVKYLHNILRQYELDGLSSQRYSRTTQQGQGEDILSGISTTVTALYKDIYGIRPKWNRMGLEPNLDSSFNGTSFDYLLRGVIYHVRLDEHSYGLRSNGFAVRSEEAFGVAGRSDTLCYYHQNREDQRLDVRVSSKEAVKLDVKGWTDQQIDFTVNNTGNIWFVIEGLRPNGDYRVAIDGAISKVRASAGGRLVLARISKKRMSIRIRPDSSGFQGSFQHP